MLFRSRVWCVEDHVCCLIKDDVMDDNGFGKWMQRRGDERRGKGMRGEEKRGKERRRKERKGEVDGAERWRDERRGGVVKVT